MHVCRYSDIVQSDTFCAHNKGLREQTKIKKGLARARPSPLQHTTGYRI